MDSDGHPADRRLPDTYENKKIAPVVIEDHAWLGLGAVILMGVTIGHHSVVATNAVVTTSIPPHCVAAGNPARVIIRFE
jgi:acetyltransferase-like isoleucine patch superfamily enzyme